MDISFEVDNHRGREHIKLIKSLCGTFGPLKPLVLILKHHLIEQKLGEANTGGLNSYGLTLLIACFLTHHKHSSSMYRIMHLRTPDWKQHRDLFREPLLGELLLLFLRFHSDAVCFDPCKIGISLEKLYFNREVSMNLNRGSVPCR